MKKFKEKILKIGNKKNCFIALLMIALIAIGILTGLNGPKSGEIKANAFAPQTKNLDLNGVRYTYQTSLNELKSYDLFTNWYYRDYFVISENRENDLTFLVGNQIDGETLAENQNNDLISRIENSLRFIKSDNTNYDYNLVNRSGIFSTNNILLDIDISESNFVLNDIRKLYFNFSTYQTIPFSNTFPAQFNGFIFTLVYVPNDIEQNASKEEFAEKSIFYNYAFSNTPNDYLFDIPKYKDYSLKQIYIFYEDEENNNNNILVSNTIKYIDTINSFDDFYEVYETIDNIKFVDDNNANIITFNSYFKYDTEEIYKGNILLSETIYDKNMYDFITTRVTPIGINLNFGTNAFWGGNFNNNKPSNDAFFRVSTFGNGVACFDRAVNIIGASPSDNLFTLLNNKVVYKNQNRLLYLNGFSDLKADYNDTTYDALSAQVEDILYNVNLVGNVEEEEFNKKVEDDFLDLIKTTGLGAFIGLIIGILFGNPALGAGVGALWGFIAGIFPLLIDGLQAIFGYEFLSGLYDFFNNITEFFVRFVDMIINFFISLITNPFVLILIVVIAIIYIIYWSKNR